MLFSYSFDGYYLDGKKDQVANPFSSSADNSDVSLFGENMICSPTTRMSDIIGASELVMGFDSFSAFIENIFPSSEAKITVF